MAVNQALDNFSTNQINLEAVNFISTISQENDEFKTEYEKLLKLTSMSVKMYATSYYKSFTSLEPLEIEQIKTALANYKNDNKRINEFKSELIEDLTKFQHQIKINQVQKLNELRKQRQLMERQLRIFSVEKHKLIMDRLLKIAWPYDEKTKEYDRKISTLEKQLERNEQKIINLKTMRPMANEKDILIYQMHLKEKFAKQ